MIQLQLGSMTTGQYSSVGRSPVSICELPGVRGLSTIAHELLELALGPGTSIDFP